MWIKYTLLALAQQAFVLLRGSLSHYLAFPNPP
jgi:hypothetical protein